MRAWTAGVSVRWLVALHLARLAGIYFSLCRAALVLVLPLPLSLLPTFLVPIIITKNILLFRRLKTWPGRAAT